ncbi:hypothetical protein BVY00_00965 [bacterium G20]|nr:hypothetical protein BVY00_00965 [bacterium G20]
MLKKFKLHLLAVFTVLFFGWAPQLAQAACNDSPVASIQCGANDAAGVPAGANPSGRINHTIQSVINLISVAVGVVAVIMVIVGGFRYITSGGNQEGVKTAKNTIIYAIIGLVIVALAQIIVNFVLNKTTQPVCVSGKWDSGPNVGGSCK